MSSSSYYFERLLQTDDGRDDPYEFVAFMLWYMFLVLCCVIPTCCAYRRRRLLEARLSEQQLQMQRRIQQSNLLFFNMPRPRILETERTRILERELRHTTITLEDEHFVERTPEEGEGKPENTLQDNDFLEENVGMIRLEEHNQRQVSGMCAICLCAYEKDEELTYSELDCPHAYHKECILSWLAKQEEPKCPVCRQDFCRKQDIPDSFLSLSQYPFAAALEALEGRTIEIAENGELQIRYAPGLHRHSATGLAGNSLVESGEETAAVAANTDESTVELAVVSGGDEPEEEFQTDSQSPPRQESSSLQPSPDDGAATDLDATERV